MMFFPKMKYRKSERPAESMFGRFQMADNFDTLVLSTQLPQVMEAIRAAILTPL